MAKTNKNILKAMKKYLNSSKGKETRKKYFEAHKEKFTEYNRLYLRNRKLEFKRKGLCSQCGKKRDNPDLKTCSKCREMQRKYSLGR